MWVPIQRGGRQVLTTNNQPFSLNPNCKNLAEYRDVSENYQFAEDEDSLEIVGLPGRNGLQMFTFSKEGEYARVNYAQQYNIRGSLTLPVLERGSGNCLYGELCWHLYIALCNLSLLRHPEHNSVVAGCVFHKFNRMLCNLQSEQTGPTLKRSWSDAQLHEFVQEDSELLVRSYSHKIFSEHASTEAPPPVPKDNNIDTLKSKSDFWGRKGPIQSAISLGP
ncbi:Uncharacterized protein Fot_56853 [Forsythia ovata]|uniref:Uncharacterized protein n=1 Tax=Forsythia ovata TaxID=205694 RepID=A0ABD1NXX9_9LAMI